MIPCYPQRYITGLHQIFVQTIKFRRSCGCFKPYPLEPTPLVSNLDPRNRVRQYSGQFTGETISLNGEVGVFAAKLLVGSL